MKINKTILTILTAILLLSFSVSAYVAGYSMGSYDRPAYYNQYTYTHNSAYMGMNYIPVNTPGVGQPYYVMGQGRTLFGYGSNDCSHFGCRPVQTSHMRMNNQLDFVYYNNPSLLDARRINSQSRTVPRNYPTINW